MPKPPETIPRAATDASTLQALVPLARQVAEAAHLSSYDILALARVVHKHSAREPDDLVSEAEKAAEWIRDQRGKRQMNIRFLGNWLDRAFTTPPEGQHSNGSFSRSSAHSGGNRQRTQPYSAMAKAPDPHRDGKYAAFANRG
ncbi:MAG TPA: hypothetical protein VKQ36_09950 [Ktedonobacterales bacterium]|nr:hypothetical protein [Ktedonobacterales bacterium]